ncbi:MAG TPA: helical backbone metal receptor [Gemmatimonadales bacterium]|nr:helical backbone metal receptor [Gemmatimonadales bacterium]
MSFSIRQLLRLVPILSLLACGEDRAQPVTAGRDATALVVVDDAGDTVRLAGPARRIVSLIPATTELLFAIGAGDRVVGRTHWCDYPEAAGRIPDLGDGMNPNLEAVVAARPDLVVLYHSGQNDAAAARLRGLGIPAIQVRSDLLADVPRLAQLFGALTGRAGAADSLRRSFDRDLEAATEAAPADPPSVFLLVWDEPPMTVGRGSYLSELIERAGGINAYADLPTSSGQISVESAAARDPDVILTLSETIPAFALRPEWQVVEAVRERRFVRIAGSEFSRPGPRSPGAIRQLAAALAGAAP